jgi:hypothetical protein
MGGRVDTTFPLLIHFTKLMQAQMRENLLITLLENRVRFKKNY